jgi:malonyl CoA-acyl carrier protein transacylase
MGRFGLVFPGQGAQHPGMALDLYRSHHSVRGLFAEAGKVFGRDMASLCFTGPQELLDLTMNTQIAVVTADLAVWRALSERVAAKPVVMEGHSLGEYAALHAAGAVKLSDVLFLVDDCDVPVIPNCDPSLLHSRKRTKDLLVRQIISPVRWRETIERMAEMGVDTIIELGPKRILSGLIRRIDRRLHLLNVADEESLKKTASALNG